MYPLGKCLREEKIQKDFLKQFLPRFSIYLCQDQLLGFWYFGVWILLSKAEFSLIRRLHAFP